MSTMRLPDRSPVIIDAILALPGMMDLARGTDDQRRQLSHFIAEQHCFELGHRWGMKARAGSNMPLSKDALGFDEQDTTVSVWDWQNGSTRERVINAGDSPTYPNLPASEAVFVSVSPINHLGAPVSPDAPAAPSGELRDPDLFFSDVRSSMGPYLGEHVRQILATQEIHSQQLQALSSVLALLSAPSPTNSGGGIGAVDLGAVVAMLPALMPVLLPIITQVLDQFLKANSAAPHGTARITITPQKLKG